MTMMLRGCSAAAVWITWPKSARPAKVCNTLGNVLFMRVPLPAAMMTMSNAAMNVSSQLIRLLSAIVLVLSLGACSAVKLGYNQLPDLGYWWLDGYFDFNEAQTLRLRPEITAMLQWHRKEELPKVAAALQKAQAAMPSAMTGPQVCALFDELRGLFNNVVQRGLPVAAELAPTLAPEQLKRLEGKFAKGNEEYRRDYLKGSATERADKRLMQAVERSETFYGTLGEAQIAAVRKGLEASGFDPEVNFKERLRRQSDALAMLRGMRGNTGQAALPALQAYVQRSNASPDPAYRAYALRVTQDSCNAFATTHNSTTPEQRAKAVQVLKGYEADMRALAAQ
jgi:Family of unknown function (DUF6279)